MKICYIYLLISLKTFSQCPCVKTAVIGVDHKSLITYNNAVTAMDDVVIKLGEGVELSTHKHSGELTWFSKGKKLINGYVTPIETTSYTAKSSLDGCPDAFDMVTITVDKKTLNQPVLIFPNPVLHQATVFSEDAFITNITVYNLAAIKMFDYSFLDYSKERIISFGDLAIGIYWVHVFFHDGKKVVEKIIKN